MTIRTTAMIATTVNTSTSRTAYKNFREKSMARTNGVLPTYTNSCGLLARAACEEHNVYMATMVTTCCLVGA